MKFYYTSDLHLDFYVIAGTGNYKKKLFNFLEKILPKDINSCLIIAGDISHYPEQIKIFCEYISKNFKYSFITAGNHEFYNISSKMRYKFKNKYSKINYIKNNIKKYENVFFLDGDIIEIENIKIGGAISWYDGSWYYKTNKMYNTNIIEIWRTTMNDANYIPEIKDFYDLWMSERKKIINVLEQKPDIMITHVCPVAERIVFNDIYANKISNAFYCFDGLEMIDKYKPKYWVYGHMHDLKEINIYDTTLLRNPLGYPTESQKKDFKLKSIKL